MKKNITARHFDLTAEVKKKAYDEIDGLTRYFDNIISADLVLEIERHRNIAELNVKVYNTVLTGTGDTDNMYTSISAAVDKVKSQLIKHKSKLKNKRPEEIAGAINELTKPSTDVDSVDE